MLRRIWPMMGVVLFAAIFLGCCEKPGPITCYVMVVDENGNLVMSDSVGGDPTPDGFKCASTVYADSVGSDTTPSHGRPMYFLDSVGSDTTP